MRSLVGPDFAWVEEPRHQKCVGGILHMGIDRGMLRQNDDFRATVLVV